MSKVAVVYWSGTGNTEMMANAVADGAKKKGAEVEIFTPADFDSAKMDLYDAVAFGCPAMGAEVLEESEFQPMFDDCAAKLEGKKIALFGSWGWGGGEWMRQWEARVKDDGAQLIGSLAIENAPDEKGLADSAALGASLVKALA